MAKAASNPRGKAGIRFIAVLHGSTRVSAPNGISIRSYVFVQTDRRQRYGIIDRNSPHVIISMQPKNAKAGDNWYSGSLWRNLITEALWYGTRCRWITQFHLLTVRSSTNGDKLVLIYRLRRDGRLSWPRHHSAKQTARPEPQRCHCAVFSSCDLGLLQRLLFNQLKCNYLLCFYGREWYAIINN